MCPVDKKEVSSSKNRFKKEVKIAIKNILLKVFKYFFKEISDLYARSIVYSKSKSTGKYVEEKNIIKNKTAEKIIFTLGSSLCTKELPDKYLPIDVFFINFLITSFRFIYF